MDHNTIQITVDTCGQLEPGSRLSRGPIASMSKASGPRYTTRHDRMHGSALLSYRKSPYWRISARSIRHILRHSGLGEPLAPQAGWEEFRFRCVHFSSPMVSGDVACSTLGLIQELAGLQQGQGPILSLRAEEHVMRCCVSFPFLAASCMSANIGETKME